MDFMKSGGFHTDFIRISCEIERPLARNCNPMFLVLIGTIITVMMQTCVPH